MKRTILIICGGIEAVHGIRRAKEMGLRVVVSDGSPSAPGLAEADDALIASTYDVEATVAWAHEYERTKGKIDGVLSIGADVPLTVASVAHALNLPGLSLEAARIATDKLAMKERLAEARIPIPWFAAVDSADHLERLRARRELIVKPVDSRGSRGVVRLTRDVDTVWAFEQAREISPTHRVMAEAYLDGPQVSTESVVVGKDILTPGFADRNYELLERYAPYFIENGGDQPSSLPPAVQDDVRRTVALAANALDFNVGTIKGDVVVHKGRAHIIELAPRLSGGYFCTLEIPLNTGVDFVGVAIKAALGERISHAEVTPKLQRPVVQRYLFPEPGRIVSITGVEQARKMPGVEHLILSRGVGDVTHTTKDTTSRSAMVITTGIDVAEARAHAEAAIKAIKITIDARQARETRAKAG
ncbi:MAG: ATP-grasp domain-containing protein [Alphaproteobacteria bacterium]